VMVRWAGITVHGVGLLEGMSMDVSGAITVE
jgi:hypothetical protein